MSGQSVKHKETKFSEKNKTSRTRPLSGYPQQLNYKRLMLGPQTVDLA